MKEKSVRKIFADNFESGPGLNPKFTAKIKDSDEYVTGYYCPYHFAHGLRPAIIEVSEKVVIQNEIEPETMRPAGEGK